MNSFWSSFFEHLKDYGRHGVIFMFALAGFFGLCCLAAVICGEWLREAAPYLREEAPYLVAGIGAFAVAGFLAAARRLRAQRRQRFEIRPLSCDELRAARSKLLKDRKAKSP